MDPVGKSLISQLAPAHAPAAPGLWPPAPGWWGLAVLLLVMLGLWVAWLRRPVRRLRRAALRELRQLEAGATNDTRLAQGLELLLRRYAMARFGAATVGRLSGDSWIEFVAGHGGKDLSGTAGRELLRAAYGGGGSGGRERWLRGARGFLRSRA